MSHGMTSSEILDQLGRVLDQNMDMTRQSVLPVPVRDVQPASSCAYPIGSGSQVVIAALAGARLGQLFVAAKGIAAVGALGKGVAFGAPAGPVGMALGAVAGVALYGLFRAFDD